MSITNTIPLPGSHFISLANAVIMTGRYRSNREAILATAYQGQNILPLSETFNRDAFDTLLALDDCAGIRIYYGMGEDLAVHALAVAVNEDNEDILPDTTVHANNEGDGPEYIIEEGQRCPDLCPDPSPLNP